MNHSAHQKGAPWVSFPDGNAASQIFCSVPSISKEFLAWCWVSVFFTLLWGQNISHENLVKCFTCHFRNVFHCVFNTPTESRIIIFNHNHGLTNKKSCVNQLPLLNWINLNSVALCGPLLWHFRLWSFQGRDTKLERFLAKNQHT